MRSRHAIIVLLFGCGRLEEPTSPGVEAETGGSSEAVPDAGAPSIRRGSGAIGLSLSASGGGHLWAAFHAEPDPEVARPPGCYLYDRDDIPVEQRTGVSAGRIKVTTTNGDAPVAMDLLWDPKRAAYFDGSVPALEPRSLGHVRFQANGGDVPPFDVTIEPLRPLTISAPSDGAVLRDRDLAVQWETDEPAAGLVQLLTGGGRVVCSFLAGVRALTIPGHLVAAALAARRDMELPASCAADAPSCGAVIVGLVRGKSITAGDYDVSVNMSLVESRDLAIGAE